MKVRAGTTTAVLSAGVALLAATVGADGRGACPSVPIHRILSSAGGIYELPDGRQLRAAKLDVGGCTTMESLPTGIAYPDSNSNYTVMSHGRWWVYHACARVVGEYGRGWGGDHLGGGGILCLCLARDSC